MFSTGADIKEFGKKQPSRRNALRLWVPDGTLHDGGYDRARHRLSGAQAPTGDAPEGSEVLPHHRSYWRDGTIRTKEEHGLVPLRDRTPLPDPAISALIKSVSEKLGLSRQKIGSEKTVERCIYALTNDRAKILEEGVALRSSDIVWVYGYGFPRYRSGPMF